jgi:hypothetical protein
MGQLGPSDLGGTAGWFPRSLHYVTPSRLRINRRIRTMRKKKPGHSGRDDRFFDFNLLLLLTIVRPLCPDPIEHWYFSGLLIFCVHDYPYCALWIAAEIWAMQE